MSKPKAHVVVNAGTPEETHFLKGRGWLIEEGHLIILSKDRDTIAEFARWESVAKTQH